MDSADLQLFYEDLVRTLRDRGVVCGITSGLACVHYGIAETTRDCDLLCHPDSFGVLLDLLSETRFGGARCQYRGRANPPLDARWHAGGWTSHFEWAAAGETVTLDVFGQAVRQSSPWEHDLAGLYAGMNVVAEMKRTDRDKDWPFVSSLGVELLRARDPRGWLHLFDAEKLLEMQAEFGIPDDLLPVRPVLRLVADGDARLRGALQAERHLWQELDRLRMRLYRAALRPYVAALGRTPIPAEAVLREQHTLRVACAEKTLPRNPIADHGVEPLIQAALDATGAFVQPELLEWLPDARRHFTFLSA